MYVFLLPASIFFIVFILCQLKCSKQFNETNTSFRRSFVISLLAHSCLIFLFNELLSVFNAISPTNATIFWALIVGLEVLFYYYLSAKGFVNKRFWADAFKSLSRKNFSDQRLTVSVAILLYVLPLLMVVVIVPPNNFDAHSYHLSRIIAWLGNGNLNHFPTRHIQQLYHNVFGEYLVMHTYLLSGTDSFAGFVQFFASMGSILAISLVAKKLGASRREQILCGILLLTLPIGIMESTTVQVDYVACFFFISFVYFGFEAIDSPQRDTLPAMALSLAFGAFSKYTILMYALPFSAYFGIRFFYSRGILQTLKILVLFVVILTAVFSPFMTRNYQFFGNVLSPTEGYGLEVEKLSVEDFSVKATLSGIMKNSSLHLGLPLNDFNIFIEQLITKAHSAIDFNVNDPRYSMDTFTVRFDVHEDMVPNNLHFILIIISLLALFFVKSTSRTKWFAVCAFAGFVIFCSMMVFQLWSTRTHMPFFAMGCVLSALLFGRLLKNKTEYLSAFLLLASSGYILGNPSKPLLPLKYYSKKFLNYVPVAICPENQLQEDGIKSKLRNFYETVPNESDCYMMKQNPDKEERQIIFGLLDSLGYYNDDKFETVFALNKDKKYFLNHPGNYENFKGLLPSFRNVKENVGVLFKAGNGFYHYWSAVQMEKGNFGQMKYIGYRPAYEKLENAKQEFRYGYILGDDPELLSSFHQENLVDTVYHSKTFYLAKLKKPSFKRVMIDM